MDWLSHLTDAPFANIVVLAGLCFLAVGLFGKIIGKIEPDKVGRIGSAVLGIVLVFVGLRLHIKGDQESTATKTSPSPSTNQSVSKARPKPSKALAGPDACNPGFVWREATPSDHVCVSPATHEVTLQQNRESAAHRSLTGGQYGPDTCLVGYVWRETTPEDHVCVTSTEKNQVVNDNAEGPSHRLAP